MSGLSHGRTWASPMPARPRRFPRGYAAPLLHLFYQRTESTATSNSSHGASERSIKNDDRAAATYGWYHIGIPLKRRVQPNLK
jgi:hypothetical protein